MPSGSTSSTAPSPVLPSRVAPSATSRSTSPAKSPSATASSKRCRFLPCFGATGGPPHGTFGTTVRGLDRGLLVLIPHQRPAQRLGPEKPDLPGAVARELTEKAATVQERVAGLDHAELVAFGIGQHDVSLFRELADVEVACAEFERRRDRVLLSGGLVLVRWRCTRFGSTFSAPLRANRRATWV